MRVRIMGYYCILIRSNDKIADFVSVAFSRFKRVCAHTTHSVKPLYEHTKLKNEISFDLSLWLFLNWTGNIV